MEYLYISFVAILGLLFGNYLTTVYSRTLEGKTVLGIGKNGIKPFCKNCNSNLRFYEYFPVLSWIFCRFKCRNCNYKYSMKYFFLEMFGMLISLILYFVIGLNFSYIFAMISIFSLTAIILSILNKNI